MQGIFAVVLVEVIFRAVEGEAAAADAVREAPDGIAHRAVAALIMRQRIEAEGNVRQLAALVRHENIGHNRAEVKHGHGRAGMVRQGIHRHVLTVLGRAERAGGNRHSVSSSYSCVNHASALLYITRGFLQGGRKKNVGNMTFEQSGAFSIPIQIPQIVKRKNPPPCRNAPLPRRINIETAAVCRENQNASNPPIWRM